jgi:hypothetical protein
MGMEPIMNSLRNAALLLAVVAFSLSGKPAYAQQEVAPDHFDGSEAQVHKAAPVHHQKHAHATMAHKSAAKHHRSHQAA